MKSRAVNENYFDEWSPLDDWMEAKPPEEACQEQCAPTGQCLREIDDICQGGDRFLFGLAGCLDATKPYESNPHD